MQTFQIRQSAAPFTAPKGLAVAPGTYGVQKAPHMDPLSHDNDMFNLNILEIVKIQCPFAHNGGHGEPGWPWHSQLVRKCLAHDANEAAWVRLLCTETLKTNRIK